MAKTINDSPQLAAPGAGLPNFELWIARGLFSFRALTSSVETIDKLLLHEQSVIKDLVQKCPAHRLNERVLIPRPRGLEDSSRYWSVLMTLEHLRLVNLFCVLVIRELSQGRVPTGKASTADVKPSPDVTESVISADVRAAVAEAKNLDDSARFPHPWFGPISARRWHVLAAVHLGLHRGQIESIIKLLP